MKRKYILFGGFVVLLLFLISMYFAHVVDPEGASYLEAYIITQEELPYYFTENYDVLYNLTNQDFKDYPALEEMIKYDKRIFIASDTIVGSIPVFGRRSVYSKTEISKQDTKNLLHKYAGNGTHIIILEYNGTYHNVDRVIS